MAERSCKKCFHYKACKEVASHSGYGDIYYAESQCKHFTPTADVVEVKHGKWSAGKESTGSVYAHCSACNRKMNSYCYGYAHCPLCGARMDGKDINVRSNGGNV